jgi:hypothetical protein
MGYFSKKVQLSLQNAFNDSLIEFFFGEGG